MPENCRSLYGVEIFSVGEWNGDKYSQKDLDEMVKAFDETASTFRPPLKLGHTDNQTLLQQDGLPAAGWIGKLYTEGGKLLADFIDIPNKIYDLLAKGAYKKVSAEIFWNAQINGTKYSRMLAGVALLGADLPAVTNLKDILALYSHLNPEKIKSYDFQKDGLIMRTYTFHTQGAIKMSEKSDTELKLQYELDAEKKKANDLSEQIKQHQKTAEDKDTEIAELKKNKLDAETKASQAEKALADAQLERELTEFQTEKLMSPAMRPYVKALLCEEKKEYSIQAKDQSEKKFTKAGLLKEIFKLAQSISEVNVTESSEDNQVAGNKNEKALDEKIQQYAREHKVSYSVAYKAVLKQNSAA